jgi:MSHA biogenesis protein MshG
MRSRSSRALRYPTFVVLAMMVAIVIDQHVRDAGLRQCVQGLRCRAAADDAHPDRLFSSNFMLNYGWLLLGGAVAAFRFQYAGAVDRPARAATRGIVSNCGNSDRREDRAKATLARFARQLRAGPAARRADHPGTDQRRGDCGQRLHLAKVEKMRDGVERGESILRTSITAGVFHSRGAADDCRGRGIRCGRRHDEGRSPTCISSDVEYELKTLAQQIEPILIVFLGVLVLKLALGIVVIFSVLATALMARLNAIQDTDAKAPAAPGQWSYDPVRRELGYQPRIPGAFANAAELRWRYVAQVDSLGRTVGVSLVGIN